MSAAARALKDAMYILGTQASVDFVSVGRVPLEGSLPGIDVQAVLDRHGASVTLTELPRGKKSIANTHVENCDSIRAGLLVMDA